MLTFNLVREPWIRCVDLDGKVRAVGLAEAMASSHVFAQIVDESPLVVAALPHGWGVKTLCEIRAEL